MVSQAELILRVIFLLVPGFISVFLKMVWVPLSNTINKRIRSIFIKTVIIVLCDGGGIL